MAAMVSGMPIARDEQSRCIIDNLFLPKFFGFRDEVVCSGCGMSYTFD